MAVVIQRDVIARDVHTPRIIDTRRRRRRLSSVVGRYADRARPHIVSVHRLGDTALAPTEDTVVLANERRHRLVGPQDVVIITYLPLGGGGGAGGRGGGGGKQIASAVAAIALFVVATAVAGPAAGAIFGAGTAAATFATPIITAAMPVGRTALLFPSRSGVD